MSTPTHEVLFEEEQTFRQAWVWSLLLSLFLILVIVFGLVVFQAPVKGDGDSGLVGLGVGIAALVITSVLLYLMQLSVRLDAGGLHIRFFPLFKRDIPLDQIAEWEARTYHPLLEYGGWGVRYSWRGTAYNVRGNRGVQLKFTNGKHLLIGSQRSDELAAAIRQGKQRAS